jgi:hypothetical protein
MQDNNQMNFARKKSFLRAIFAQNFLSRKEFKKHFSFLSVVGIGNGQ